MRAWRRPPPAPSGRGGRGARRRSRPRQAGPAARGGPHRSHPKALSSARSRGVDRVVCRQAAVHRRGEVDVVETASAPSAGRAWRRPVGSTTTSGFISSSANRAKPIRQCVPGRRLLGRLGQRRCRRRGWPARTPGATPASGPGTDRPPVVSCRRRCCAARSGSARSPPATRTAPRPVLRSARSETPSALKQFMSVAPARRVAVEEGRHGIVEAGRVVLLADGEVGQHVAARSSPRRPMAAPRRRPRGRRTRRRAGRPPHP